MNFFNVLISIFNKNLLGHNTYVKKYLCAQEFLAKLTHKIKYLILLKLKTEHAQNPTIDHWELLRFNETKIKTYKTCLSRLLYKNRYHNFVKNTKYKRIDTQGRRFKFASNFFFCTNILFFSI